MNSRLFRNVFVLSALIIGLTNCSYQKHYEHGPADYGSRTEAHENGRAAYPHTQSRTADHNNKMMAYSQTTSDAIADMNGIRASFVILTDKNAYVAIVLDNTATGAKGKGELTPSDRTIGAPDIDHHSSITQYWTSGDVVREKYSYDTIADPQNISNELQSELANKVRELHPNVQHVFVSANQHFVNQISRYAHEAWKGNSLDPFLAEFNKLVGDHFGDRGIMPQTPEAGRETVR